MARPSELDSVLQHVDAGQVASEIDAAIRDIARKVAERGGKGKISLEIGFSRMGDNRVQVAARLKTSEPVPVREASLFFVTEHGLSRRDPNQMEIPGLRTLEGG